MKRSMVTCALAASLLAAVATSSPAANYRWTGGSGGDFGRAGNWAPVGGPPGADDVAIIQVKKDVDMTIKFSADRTVSELRVLNGRATLDLGGKTCKVTAARGVWVGFEKTNNEYKDAELTIIKGKLEGSGAIARSSDGKGRSSGKVTIGEGGSWDMGTGSAVGADGEATMNIEAGGSVTADKLVIGEGKTATAYLTLRGKRDKPAKLTTTDLLTVGSDGTGHLRVGDFSTLDSRATTIQAKKPVDGDASSSVIVTGGEALWDMSGKLLVGGEGKGQVRLESRGKLDIAAASPAVTVSVISTMTMNGGRAQAQDGAAASDIQVAGIFAVGTGGGALKGKLTLQRGCWLSLSLPRAETLLLRVDGEVALNGELRVNRGDFAPRGGDWYSLVQATRMTGALQKAQEIPKRGDAIDLTSEVTPRSPQELRVKWPGGAPSTAPGAQAGFALGIIGANPRPAMHGLEIVWEIPAGAAGTPMTIALYDVGGRRVETVASGMALAGRHTAVAAGAATPSLAPGVYFLRMEAGAFHATRRITLLP